MTYFGTAANPADSGALAGPNVTITPPGSMVAGDLVVVFVQYRGGSVLINKTTGGQTWSSPESNFSGNVELAMFFCIFNGTWSADPVFGDQVLGSQAISGIMHVFRSTSGYSFVGRDTDVTTNSSYSAPSSPFDVTIPADTSTEARIVAVGFFSSDDDNTWALQSGTWTNAGSAQYRNTQGQDQSNSSAYKFFTSPGTIDAVTNRQATLGGDPGIIMEFGFYETAVSVGRSFGAIID